MSEYKVFIFNPFYENTYIVYDKSGECVIIDPGCEDIYEERKLTSFLTVNNLTPVRLLNTHCHIDHIFGNKFITEKYDLVLEANEKEDFNIKGSDLYAQQFGMQAPQSPSISKFLKEGDNIEFGETRLEIYDAPGHSPGHIVFFDAEMKLLFGGDVLFRESIGRTDLPGGDMETLIKSIKDKIFPLGDDVTVLSGHGPLTTIGYEKANNPFLKNI